MVEILATLVSYLAIAVTLGPIWAVAAFLVRVLVGYFTKPNPWPLYFVQFWIYSLAIVGVNQWNQPYVTLAMLVFLILAVAVPITKVLSR